MGLISVKGSRSRKAFILAAIINFSILAVIVNFASETVSSIYVFFYLYLEFCNVSKRFHDLGKSAWYSLLMLIPFVNIIVVIILLFTKGDSMIADSTQNSVLESSYIEEDNDVDEIEEVEPVVASDKLSKLKALKAKRDNERAEA